MEPVNPVATFARYPTSSISDALDELGIAGAFSGIGAMREGLGRVCGRALPVRFVRKAKAPDAYRFGGGVGKPLEIVLKTMRAGDVVVMDLDGATNASAWGGLASRLAQRRGVRGTILWGTCRDLEEIRAVGYPVWAVGVPAPQPQRVRVRLDQRADRGRRRRGCAGRRHRGRRERRGVRPLRSRE